MADHLVEATVSRLRHPPEDPEIADFVSALDRINRLAEDSPGFVWRLPSENGRPSLADVTGDPLLVINMSVWTSYPLLHEYVYRSAHSEFVRRRTEWFDRVAQPNTVLWWVPAGTRPTVADALARLEHLQTNGPTPRAFSLRTRFDSAGRREDHRNDHRERPRGG